MFNFVTSILFICIILTSADCVFAEEMPSLQISKEQNKEQNEADALIKKATTLFNEHKFDEALVYCNKALNIDKTNTYAYYLCYQIALAKGDTKAALSYCDQLHKNNPAEGTAYALRSQVYFVMAQKENNDEYLINASNDMIKSLKIKNDSSDADIVRGYLNLIRGGMMSSNEDEIAKKYLNKAKSYAKKAIEINPKNAKGYNLIGVAKCYLNSLGGKLDINACPSILEDFNKALTVNPSYGNAYQNRGSIYVKLKKYDLAIKDYTQAIVYDESKSKAASYSGRAFCYAKKKDYESAMKDYNRSIAENKNNRKAYNNRGIIYAIQGNMKNALVDFQMALNVNENYSMASKNIDIIKNGEDIKNLEWDELQDIEMAIIFEEKN